MEIIAKVLYGSQNYGLSTPKSDEDYKLIVRPTFDDLYCGRNLNEKRQLPSNFDPEHYSTMDIRKWFSLIQKGNINAVEYLFSSNFEYIQPSPIFISCVEAARKLYHKGWLNNAWPTFFASVEGSILNTLKRMGTGRKTLARVYYYRAMLDYLVLYEGVMTSDTWSSYLVTKYPAKIRFTDYGNELARTTTIEDIKENFEKIKGLSQQYIRPRPELEEEMNELQIRVYNYIKGEIVNEH